MHLLQKTLTLKLNEGVRNLKLDPKKTGLGLGSLVALTHLIWSLLVALGLAQGWMEWILSLHFLDNPFTVGTFEVVTALTLIVVTGLVGFVIGWVFAKIWNYWQKKS